MDECLATFKSGGTYRVKLAHGEGTWRTILWGYDVSLNGWYIVNTLTGEVVYIGKVGAKRTNYREVARAECIKRNGGVE